MDSHKHVVLHHHVSRAIEEASPVFHSFATIPFAVYRSKAWVRVVDNVAIDQPTLTNRQMHISKQTGNPADRIGMWTLNLSHDPEEPSSP